MSDLSKWRAIEARYDGPLPFEVAFPADHACDQEIRRVNRRKLAWRAVRQYGRGALAATRRCRRAPTAKNRRARMTKRRHLKYALNNWQCFRGLRDGSAR